MVRDKPVGNYSGKSVHSKRAFGWGWIFWCLLIRRKSLVLVVLMLFFGYSSGLVLPICAQHAIDMTIAGKFDGTLLLIALVAFASIVIEAASLYFRQRGIIDLGTFLDRRVSKKVFLHLMRREHDGVNLNPGLIINTVQQISKIRSFVLQTIPQTVFEVGGSIASFVLLLSYDFFVAICLFLIGLISAVSARAKLRNFHASANQYHRSEVNRQSFLAELSSSLFTLKSQGMERNRFGKWMSLTDSLLQALSNHSLLGRRYQLQSQFSLRLVSFVTIVLCCIQLGRHQISFGDVAAIQLLVIRAISPLLNSSDFIRQYKELSVAMASINVFLSAPLEKADTKRPVRQFVSGGISVSNLSFRYPGAQVNALDGVDISLPRTGIYAIIGRNGCGKTTLMKVLTGILRQYAGNVCVMGGDIRHYHPRWYREQIGVVDQDTNLFSGSIIDNVAYGSRSADWNLLHQVFEQSGSSNVIKNLPDGVDTILGDRGLGLSGGQRQRICIARALFRDPKLILLDEPTAFLDPEAAVVIEEKLSELSDDRLVIIVTHHLASIREFDGVILMDSGKIVEFGRHVTLLDSSELYRSLWRDYERKK